MELFVSILGIRIWLGIINSLLPKIYRKKRALKFVVSRKFAYICQVIENNKSGIFEL